MINEKIQGLGDKSRRSTEKPKLWNILKTTQKKSQRRREESHGNSEKSQQWSIF